MKIYLNKSIILFFIIIHLHSCKPDDIYVDLNAEAKELLLFNVGDSFKLKNHQTNEIITLTVKSKYISHFENNPYQPVYLGPTADSYIERGEYTFTDNTLCYNGIVSVEALTNNSFLFEIYLSDCFGNSNFPFKFRNEIISNINILGISYSNAYYLKSSANDLYYSKEKGILKIVNNLNQNIRFSIVN